MAPGAPPVEKNCTVAGAAGCRIVRLGMVTCTTGAPAEKVKRPVPRATVWVVVRVMTGASTISEPK